MSKKGGQGTKMELNEKRRVRLNIGIHLPSHRNTSASGCYTSSSAPLRRIDFADDFGVRLWQPFLPQVFVGLSETGHHATIRSEREIPSLQKTVFSPTFKATVDSPGVLSAPTRHALLINENVRVFMKYLRPEDIVKEEKTGEPHIRKNTDRHEVLFVHHGMGFFQTALGMFHYRDGAYVIMPKGIEYRIVAGSFSSFLIFELNEYPYPAHFVGGDLPASFFYSFYEGRMETPMLAATEFVKEKTRVMHIADKGAERHFYSSSPFATIAWSGRYYPYLIAVDSIRELPFPSGEKSFDRYLTFAAVDNSGRATSFIYTVVCPSRHSADVYEDVEYDTLWFAHRRGHGDLAEHHEGDLILYPRGNSYRFADYAGSSVSIVLKTKERLRIAQGFGSRAERKETGEEEKRFSRSRSVR